MGELRETVEIGGLFLENVLILADGVFEAFLPSLDRLISLVRRLKIFVGFIQFGFEIIEPLQRGVGARTKSLVASRAGFLCIAFFDGDVIKANDRIIIRFHALSIGGPLGSNRQSFLQIFAELLRRLIAIFPGLPQICLRLLNFFHLFLIRHELEHLSLGDGSFNIAEVALLDFELPAVILPKHPDDADQHEHAGDAEDDVQALLVPVILISCCHRMLRALTQPGSPKC